ncbi:hypothetical protein GCM10010345_71890 [Streptomyces canarius]|uniref:Uncharacterized protein n=1 Tax=Streptomyces canarius TaxID=285453 RepID=A0ABQ3D3P6_9ACTN|nr:hypothetical protein GCM10010345_71890 [Streptomyces canarius]
MTTIDKRRPANIPAVGPRTGTLYTADEGSNRKAVDTPLQRTMPHAGPAGRRRRYGAGEEVTPGAGGLSLVSGPW